MLVSVWGSQASAQVKVQVVPGKVMRILVLCYFLPKMEGKLVFVEILLERLVQVWMPLQCTRKRVMWI